MVAVTRFLCCFDTTEGSYISGSWTLVAGTVRIALQIFMLRSINALTDIQREDLPVAFSVLDALSKFRTVIASITILASLVLLIGMWKSKRLLLVPWLVWVVIDETANFCIMISFIIRRLVKLTETPSIYVVDGVLMFLDIYCVLCVYSCYKQMNKNGPTKQWSQRKTLTATKSDSEFSLDMSSDDDDKPLIIPNTVSRSRPI